MDRYPYARPPRWWSPRPNRLMVSLWKPVRRFQQRRGHRIERIEVRGLEHVRAARRAGHGLLITPNHSSHGDCYVLFEALPRLRCRSYIMTAWQVFQLAGPVIRLAYQQHGCFSVDREGSDTAAYRRALHVLSETCEPLVMFPEGEVYHLNEHVTPFREGTLSVAQTAARRSGRPVACVPCGMRYFYREDPTPELLPVIEQIERRLACHLPAPASLAERVERLLEAVVVWRERQFLGSPQAGGVESRIASLADVMVSDLERRFGLAAAADAVPERVKRIRKRLIELRQAPATTPVAQHEIESAMEQAFVAIQLYSYRPGYIAESPSIERVAETVDKLEEDVLNLQTARIRGVRQAVITFGEPLLITEDAGRAAARAASETLRQRVQAILDDTRV